VSHPFPAREEVLGSRRGEGVHLALVQGQEVGVHHDLGEAEDHVVVAVVVEMDVIEAEGRRHARIRVQGDYSGSLVDWMGSSPLLL
jgi:hypothetical protein